MLQSPREVHKTWIDFARKFVYPEDTHWNVPGMDMQMHAPAKSCRISFSYAYVCRAATRVWQGYHTTQVPDFSVCPTEGLWDLRHKRIEGFEHFWALIGRLWNSRSIQYPAPKTREESFCLLSGITTIKCPRTKIYLCRPLISTYPCPHSRLVSTMSS